MVVTIVPGILDLIRIQVVIGKETNGLSFVGLDDDLSFLAQLADLIVLPYQDYVVTGAGRPWTPALASSRGSWRW